MCKGNGDRVIRFKDFFFFYLEAGLILDSVLLSKIRGIVITWSLRKVHYTYKYLYMYIYVSSLI